MAYFNCQPSTIFLLIVFFEPLIFTIEAVNSKQYTSTSYDIIMNSARQRRDLNYPMSQEERNLYPICCEPEPVSTEKAEILYTDCYDVSVNKSALNHEELIRTSACAVECLVRQTFPKLYKVDGTIRRRKFFEFEFSNYEKDDDTKWLVEMTKRYYDDCMLVADEIDRQLYIENDQNCDYVLYGLQMCLWRKIITVCPESRKIWTETCIELRKKFKETPNVYFWIL